MSYTPTNYRIDKDKRWALHRITRLKDEIFSDGDFAEGKKEMADAVYEVVGQIRDVKLELEDDLPDKVKAYAHAELNRGRTLCEALEIAPLEIYEFISREDKTDAFVTYWVYLRQMR